MVAVLVAAIVFSGGRSILDTAIEVNRQQVGVNVSVARVGEIRRADMVTRG